MLITGCDPPQKVTKRKQIDAPVVPTLTVFKISKYIKRDSYLTVKDFNDAFMKMVFYNKSFITLDTMPGTSKIIAGTADGSNGVDDDFTKFKRIIQPYTSCHPEEVIDYDLSGLPQTVRFKFDVADESFRLIFVKLNDSSFKLKGNARIKLADGTGFDVIARTTVKQCRLYEKFKRTQTIKTDIKTAGGVRGSSGSSPAYKPKETEATEATEEIEE